ncbi:MAG: hypothetical protein H7Y59_06500 [Anaerolineales bacterium]|nr:hypothetical protein [Anaerolineales bacterium]
MKTNKIFSMFVMGILSLSMLGCIPTPPVEATVVPVVVESTPTTEVPAGNSSGACANPYLPVIVGATWGYKVTGPVSDTFTRTILSVEPNSFTDQDVFGTGVTRQSKWNCDNGNLTALNPASGVSSSVNTENVTIDFQTTEFSGITLPATINPGDTWSQSATLEGVQTITGIEVPTKNQFTVNCTAIGIETITVEAGTFDAMRFDCPITMNITITMNDSPIQTDLAINSMNWHAQDIGLIKTTTTGTGFDSTIELVSYSIPLSP